MSQQETRSENAASQPRGRGIGAPPAMPATLATFVQAGLILAGAGMIAFGFSLKPSSAIHEIYQLNLISTGLMLFAVTGVWAGVDALRRDR